MHLMVTVVKIPVVLISLVQTDKTPKYALRSISNTWKLNEPICLQKRKKSRFTYETVQCEPHKPLHLISP